VPTTSFTAISTGGYSTAMFIGATWATVRASSTSGGTEASPVFDGETGKYGSDYYIYRSLCGFVTSALPDDATITKVELSLVAASQGGNGQVNSIVTTSNTSYYPTTGTTTKWAIGNFGTSSLGDFPASVTAGTTYTRELTGLTVSKTGNTWVGVRSDADLGNSAPSGLNYTQFHSGIHSTEANRPILIVTYAGCPLQLLRPHIIPAPL
jgi:hypothetical protein